MTRIHPTAIIHEGAQLHPSVEVGAYSVIHAGVRIDEGTRVGEHCVISGRTTIGKNNLIYRFCSIGCLPQDLKYAGEDTALIIGDENSFREFVTISIGTVQDKGRTIIGNKNLFMAYVHVAHDCVLGSNGVYANAATLAGHVVVGDYAVIGGMTAVHQFTRIGAHCMIGGVSAIRQDVPPYVLGAGQPFHAAGINSEGLKRRCFTPEQIRVLKKAFMAMYKHNLSQEEARAAIEQLAVEHPDMADSVLRVLIDFLSESGRGFRR